MRACTSPWTSGVRSGLLDERAVRARIDRIGYTAFEEIRSVLSQEAFLLPPAELVSVYVEFAAVFLELRYFAPMSWRVIFRPYTIWTRSRRFWLWTWTPTPYWK